MRQIRGRIRDKRGVDYTEEQIRELAAAKLERFLDPTGVRSDLLEQFRTRPSLPPGFLYQFEDTTLFDSDKPIVRFFRRLLHPFLKLLFNPNVLSTHAAQAGRVQPVRARPPAAAVRAAPQPGARADARQHRGEEPEDAARVGAEPAGVQRAPRAGARGGGAVQARGAGATGDGTTAAAISNSAASTRADQGRAGPFTGSADQPRASPAAAAGPCAAASPQSPQVAAAAVAVEEPATPGTEPQGGIDPITGGDSLRTRRRRRRRGRRGLGEQSGIDTTRAVDGASDSGSGGKPTAATSARPRHMGRSRRSPLNPDADHDQAGDSPAPGSATSIAPMPSRIRRSRRQLGSTGRHGRRAPGADSNVRLKPDAAGDDAGDTAARSTSTRRPAMLPRHVTWDPASAGSQPDTTPDVERAARTATVRLQPDATYDRDDERQ